MYRILWLFIFATSCVSHKDEFELKEETNQSLEIKQAELWSRVDKLEETVQKQQDKIAFLERTRMEELQSKDEIKKPSSSEEKILNLAKEVPKVPVTNTPNHSSYMSRFQEAKKLFEKKVWHRAFVLFSELERNTDVKVSRGEPLYWVARCWFEMKEYQTSNVLFKRFVQKFPSSNLKISAKLFLAKTYIAMGSREDAFDILKELIKNNPGAKVSEIAKRIMNEHKEEEI